MVHTGRVIHRRHTPTLRPSDRRSLERAGWRTTLDYRENHVRASDGRLVRVEPVWSAEAERTDDGVWVATATGPTAEAAWRTLAERIRLGAIDPVGSLAGQR